MVSQSKKTRKSFSVFDWTSHYTYLSNTPLRANELNLLLKLLRAFFLFYKSQNDKTYTTTFINQENMWFPAPEATSNGCYTLRDSFFALCLKMIEINSIAGKLNSNSFSVSSSVVIFKFEVVIPQILGVIAFVTHLLRIFSLPSTSYPIRYATNINFLKNF